MKGGCHGNFVVDSDGAHRWCAGKDDHAGNADPGGFIITIVLGVAGAFVGGYLGSALGLGAVTGFNLGSLLLAIGGAVLLLIVYRVIKR